MSLERIARSPLRLSLAGGGTDLPAYSSRFGGEVLAMAIDAEIVVRAEPGGAEVEMRWSDQTGDLPGDPALNDLVAQIVHAEPAWSGRPLVLSSRCSARAGSGLGSSGAFLVAVAAMLRPSSSPLELARTAFDWECHQAGRTIGPQDAVASACGGLHHITIDPAGAFAAGPLDLHPRSARWIDDNLLLFDTGTSRDASRVIARTHGPGERTHQARSGGTPTEGLHRIRSLVAPFREALERGHVERFGPLLSQNWELKAALGSGVSTPRAEDLLRTCRSAGAHGGKLVGAGGGGYILVSVPDDSLASVRAAMAAEGAPELPFALSARGARASAAGVV